MSMQRQGQQQHKRIPWGRISIAIILSFLFAGGAIVGIVNNLNSLFNILSITFAVLGAVFALFQWFFPFSSPNTTESPPMHAPSLIPPITVHVSTPHTLQTLDTSLQRKAETLSQ